MYDDYIFTKPSFLRGVARVVDLGGTLARESIITSPSTWDADQRALASDLRVVAKDMNRALESVPNGEK